MKGATDAPQVHSGGTSVEESPPTPALSGGRSLLGFSVAPTPVTGGATIRERNAFTGSRISSHSAAVVPYSGRMKESPKPSADSSSQYPSPLHSPMPSVQSSPSVKSKKFIRVHHHSGGSGTSSPVGTPRVNSLSAKSARGQHSYDKLHRHQNNNRQDHHKRGAHTLDLDEDDSDFMGGAEALNNDEKLKELTFSSKGTEFVFPLNTGKSLGLFGPTNAFRIYCAEIVSAKHFDNFVLMLIIVSTAGLILTTPLLDPESSLSTGMTLLNIVLTVCFSIECFLKIVALGIYSGDEGGYLSSPWNVLDFLIVILSLLSIFVEGNNNLKSLRSLRALRGLRPLRVINRAPGLKLIVNTLALTQY